MLNQDKSILVAYLNTHNMNREKGLVLVHQFKQYLEDKFINTKEINDDSLVILVVPADRTEIVLLNSKYPDYEQIKKDAELVLENYINKEKIS
jgi:hypothetical protein